MRDLAAMAALNRRTRWARRRRALRRWFRGRMPRLDLGV
jgi:hypothetical protein